MRNVCPCSFFLGSGLPLSVIVVATLSAAWAVSPLTEFCLLKYPFLYLYIHEGAEDSGFVDGGEVLEIGIVDLGCHVNSLFLG